jgi:hypothetical protein
MARLNFEKTMLSHLSFHHYEARHDAEGYLYEDGQLVTPVNLHGNKKLHPFYIIDINLKPNQDPLSQKEIAVFAYPKISDKEGYYLFNTNELVTGLGMRARQQWSQLCKKTMSPEEAEKFHKENNPTIPRVQRELSLPKISSTAVHVLSLYAGSLTLAGLAFSIPEWNWQAGTYLALTSSTAFFTAESVGYIWRHTVK